MLPSDPITLEYGKWKKISNAGETGTAWMNKVGNDGSSRVMLAHTDSAQTPSDDIEWDDATDLNEKVGYQLSEDGVISPVLAPDNVSDIFYATLLDIGETCQIIVDIA